MLAAAVSGDSLHPHTHLLRINQTARQSARAELTRGVLGRTQGSPLLPWLCSFPAVTACAHAQAADAVLPRVFSSGCVGTSWEGAR